MTKSNYDKFPAIPVPGGEGAALRGWDDIVACWRAACEPTAGGGNRVLSGRPS